VYLMDYAMPYGKDSITISLPVKDCIIRELILPEHPAVRNPKKVLLTSFQHPIQSDSLQTILNTKKPKSITIVVDDQTRKFPHRQILIPLLEYLKQNGIHSEHIRILIATGVHQQPTMEQLHYLFGNEIVTTYSIRWNDQSKSIFHDFGTTSRGTPVQINSIYTTADLKIIVSDVTLHYFAGFGGDRKSIFPGIASAQGINKNHSMVMEGIYPGTIENNPIHEDMMEAASLVGADFVINVSLDSDGNILDIKSGALKHAFIEAVQCYQQSCRIAIKKQADLLILSAGGYPFDSNYQQSMKAVMQCQQAVKPGGKVLYFLKGENGIGIPAFKSYLDQFLSSQSIQTHIKTHEYQQGMHNAYYYRKFTEDHEVYYKTDLPKKYVMEVLKVSFVEDLQSCINKLVQSCNSVYIIRYGSKVLITHEP